MHRLLLVLAIVTVAGCAVVKEWIASARQPKTNRPYIDMVYQPMLELLAYLRAK